jgi:hypothetical protein
VGLLVLVGCLAALAGGGIGYAVGRPDRTTAAIADLQAAEAQRDKQQIKELTDLARRVRDDLNPIMSALQTGDKSVGPPNATQVRSWQQKVRGAAERFADPPSGTTATNVARGGLRNAVDQSVIAVETYAMAARSVGAQRQALLALAARQGSLAAATWSVAATQLDQINIDAGYGHQHVYLQTGSGTGAFTPDEAAEGTDK